MQSGKYSNVPVWLSLFPIAYSSGRQPVSLLAIFCGPLANRFYKVYFVGRMLAANKK